MRTARVARFPGRASQLRVGLAARLGRRTRGLRRRREALVAVDGEPVRGDHALGVCERDRAAADLALQVGLYGVLLMRVGVTRPELGPEVGDIGRRAA